MNNTYKCPSCGGPLTFDQATQKLKCPYCGFEQDIKDFEGEEIVDKTHIETDVTNLYLCSSCGGEVIMENKSAASTCPFCDNPIVISTKFSDDFKPDYVVPFQNKKEDIIQAFQKHMDDKKFLPKEFKNRNLLKDIKGIYVPYWIYDLELEAEMKIVGETEIEKLVGNTNHITRSIYDLYRKARIDYKELPISASKKMDEEMLDSIEPFNLATKVSFSPDYLSGFYAENYDAQQSDKTKHVLKRTEKTLENEILKTLEDFELSEKDKFDVKVLKEDISYALLPVWFLTTRYNNEEYIFAMNGVSGKLIGDLPFDKSLYYKYLSVRFAIVTVIVYGILTLLS